MWTLLQQINGLRTFFKVKIDASTGIVIKLSSLLLIGSTLMQCIYKLARALQRSKPSRRGRCRFFGVQPRSKQENAAVEFFSKLISHHLDWNVHYAMALLYCFCCRELGKTIRVLCANHEYFNSRKIWKRYYVIRDCVKEIESRFSVLVFILFARSFLEFFRVLTLLLNRIQRNLDVTYSFVNGLHSCMVLMLFISVVVSANYLVKSYKKLCVKMMRIPHEAYCTGNKFDTYRDCRLVLNHKDSIALTAWGMIPLNKNLLVTAIATLVTYGVLLHQFHGK